MKRMHERSGFTIVELLIVIAVIGVLAAVLIPTFSEVMVRAKKESDQAEIANMNLILALNPSVTDTISIQRLLEAEGFSLCPRLSKTHRLWFDTANHCIILAENAEMFGSEVAFADDGTEPLEPEALSPVRPECRYIDKTQDVISQTLAVIRSLGDRSGDINTLFETACNALPDTLSARLSVYHPSQTLYVGKENFATAATQSVKRVVFSPLVTELPTYTADISIACEVAFPSYISAVSESFLAHCEITPQITDLTVYEDLELPINPENPDKPTDPVVNPENPDKPTDPVVDPENPDKPTEEPDEPAIYTYTTFFRLTREKNKTIYLESVVISFADGSTMNLYVTEGSELTISKNNGMLEKFNDESEKRFTSQSPVVSISITFRWTFNPIAGATEGAIVFNDNRVNCHTPEKTEEGNNIYCGFTADIPETYSLSDNKLYFDINISMSY